MSQYTAGQFDRCDLLTIAGDVDCDVRSVVSYLKRDKTTHRAIAKAIESSITRLRDEGRIKPHPTEGLAKRTG
jgi:hypothetical protein